MAHKKNANQPIKNKNIAIVKKAIAEMSPRETPTPNIGLVPQGPKEIVITRGKGPWVM